MSHNYDSCQPTCFMFWSAFWGLKSAAFSDLESFVIMSKLLQLLVITLILKCLLVWARYTNVPSHYHAQGIKEMGAGHSQLCRPWCLGLIAACALRDMGREWGKKGESFICFSAAQSWRGTVAEQGSAWSASNYYNATWSKCADQFTSIFPTEYYSYLGSWRNTSSLWLSTLHVQTIHASLH